MQKDRFDHLPCAGHWHVLKTGGTFALSEVVSFFEDRSLPVYALI